MADIWDSAKRSAVMSAIRGRGNLSTEMRMVRLLRAAGLVGWRRHQRLPGRPDFVFRREKVAIFVDGCFWHGCPRCYKAPATRGDFWAFKLADNRRRDRRVSRQLRAMGWAVVRVWECRLRASPARDLKRIRRKLNSGTVNEAS